MDKSPLFELHAIFRGRVQGVGFRWTVADYAKAQELKGSVRNCQDGSVEVIAQGPKNKLEKFLEAIQKDPGSARIDSVTTKYSTAKTLATSFQIL